MPEGDYEASPAPGGTARSARKRLTINGLSYGSVGDHVTAVGMTLVKLGFGRPAQLRPADQRVGRTARACS
ncbi:hypothetical protein SUDANB21_06850 (plasmid) [Streptomyces sp. enrichment culture]